MTITFIPELTAASSVASSDQLHLRQGATDKKVSIDTFTSNINSGYYSCTGPADTYTLSNIDNQQPPTSYVDGMDISFIPSASNTGDSTVAPGGLAAKDLKMYDGSSLLSGQLLTTRLTKAAYNLLADEFRITNGLSSTGLTGDVALTDNLGVSSSIAASQKLVDDTYNTLSGEIDSLDTAILLRLLASNNLSDLPNKATSRANLSVYSIAQSDSLLSGKLSIVSSGSNANGYWREYSDGFKEQWGSKAMTGNTFGNFSFPTAFSSAPTLRLVTGSESTLGGEAVNFTAATSSTYSIANGAGSNTIYWHAAIQ